MLQGHQIKAARHLLGWSQEDCAKHAGIGVETVNRLEVGSGHPQQDAIDAVLAALKKAGIRFGERGKVGLEPPTGGVFPKA
jgi:predicted transcriptional regulator